MNRPSRFSQSVLAVYRAGLYLYPAEFRLRYADEMLRCAQNLLAETSSPPATACFLAGDLFRSLLTEHLAMTSPIRALPQLAMLFILTTFIAGTGYLISQQVLRMSANDPQIQLAEDGAQRLRDGEDPARVIPDRHVDMATSLAPFVIVYDDNLQPVASSAQLDGSVPRPPRGVFDFVRSNNQERVTWQPRPSVRIASVVTRSKNGFVLAGRNMREVEIRESQVFKLAAMGWLFANVALAALWLIAHLLSRTKAPKVEVTA
jgi:hypothetical protein